MTSGPPTTVRLETIRIFFDANEALGHLMPTTASVVLNDPVKRIHEKHPSAIGAVIEHPFLGASGLKPLLAATATQIG